MEASWVFVVDDDADTCELVSYSLHAYGWRVRTFGDARSCLEAIELQAPACILSDLHMPVMDGLQLMDALLAAGLHIPVVVMTASPPDSIPVLLAAARAAGVVAKPYEAEVLNDLLLRTVTSTQAVMPSALH